MTQSNLFGPTLLPKKKKKPSQCVNKKIDWSYTRRNTLLICPRKYFFYYYASTTKLDYIDKSVIYRYKRLSNKHAVFGEIIHWVIRCSLSAVHKGRDEWEEERLLSFGRKMVEDAIEDTFKLMKGQEPQYDHAFMEIYFEEEASEDIKEEGFNVVETCIENLFDHSEFYKVYEAAKIDDSLIERSTRFALDENITVNGQMDIGFYDQHSFKIVDWKTGKNHVEDTSLQLAVYGLWANEMLKIPARDIEISKAYLEVRTTDDFKFDEVELERAKARIQQDYQMMKELDGFALSGIEDAFDQCGKRLVCDKCSFKRICYDK